MSIYNPIDLAITSECSFISLSEVGSPSLYQK